MTAADRPSVPQVGDTITTADQLDALPVGVVMRARNDLLMETGRLASGDRVVWGEGWSDHADAIEHFAPLTVLYVPGEQPRPSVTDNARAALSEIRSIIEANLVQGDYETWHERPDDTLDAIWDALNRAASRAETTDERVVHNHGPTDGPGLDCPETILPDGGLRGACLNRAETTTATTEDAADHLITHQPTYSNTHLRYICRCGDESHWPTHAAQALADAGLLTTALTRPTREQIARALDRAGAFCGECGAEPGDFFDSCLECQRWLLNYADAVLALLGGDDK